MKAPFLFHGQDAYWVDTQKAEVLTLRLALEADCIPSALYLRSEPDNEEKLIEMTISEEKGRLTIWQACLPVNQDQDMTLYCFKLIFQQQQYWLHAAGMSQRMPGREKHFRYNRCHQPPAWVKEQIFYQIFPDRFCCGDAQISVKTGEYCLRGDKKPTLAKAWGEGVSTHGKEGACEFFGGDLKGIENKLDYLQDLGVTALYLNPIFTAPSNHKYDTADYFTIDPHLGTNGQFAEFTHKLHQRGMKIVLDAVFNHTSLDHPWFDGYCRRKDGQGAWKNPHSPYRNYYQFDGDSERYIGWDGIATLPKLNYLNQEVRDYFYQGENAVIKYWLRPPYEIDGWRLDVIHMLGEGKGAQNNAYYVKAFRDAAKSVNQDCYVLGEHFFEASKWLQGEQEDGAMNYYGFAHPIRAFFAGLDIRFDPCYLDAEDLVNWLMEAMAKVPWRNQLSQFNQLDSHDTMRFLTMLNGDEKRFRSALIFLFCWVGVPCIYYGTEVALEGGHDPDNRRTFPWERVETHSDSVTFVKTLTAFRVSSAALQSGSLHWLYAKQDVLSFARFIDNELVICLINRSAKPQSVSLPLWQVGIEEGEFSYLIQEDMNKVSKEQAQAGVLDLVLAPKSGNILYKLDVS